VSLAVKPVSLFIRGLAPGIVHAVTKSWQHALIKAKSFHGVAAFFKCFSSDKRALDILFLKHANNQSLMNAVIGNKKSRLGISVSLVERLKESVCLLILAHQQYSRIRLVCHDKLRLLRHSL